MIVQRTPEHEKFLWIFGSPYTTFCKCLSLRTGVLLIIVIDFILGSLSIIFGLLMLYNILFTSVKSLAYFVAISALINVIGIPFATIAMFGMDRRSERCLRLYYQYKLFEMFADGLINIVEAETEFSYYKKLISEARFSEDSIVILFIVFLLITMSAICTKVVWSVLIKLRDDQLEGFVEPNYSRIN